MFDKKKLASIFASNEAIFSELPIVKKSVVFSDKVCELYKEPSEPCECEIDVQNINTLDAALSLMNTSSKICVLNMASDVCPGGGVRKGSSAQEEFLCRTTDLYRHISSESLKNKFGKKLYPFCPRIDKYLDVSDFKTWTKEARNYDGRDIVIYSPNVQIIRNSNYELLPESERKNIAVLSIAGIRKPNLVEGKLSEEDEDTIRMKVYQILTIANLGKYESLVLGALGCGAFKNPPEQVAEIFSDILSEFKHTHLNKIIFAVLCDEEDEESNYTIFKRILG